MDRSIETKVREALAADAARRYGVELSPALEHPPERQMGDLASTIAFDLARTARKPPRKVAEELAPVLSAVEGVERVEVAGAGYLNVYLDRARYLRDFCRRPDPEPAPSGKIIVEHTNINPNKAAHIGHLRNAALGDTLVRLLRYGGERVEVQNYIDDTGVQVADVVTGFLDLEGLDLAQVEALSQPGGTPKFDYYCWDLYARVTEFYAGDPARAARREAVLKAIEEGKPPEAPLGRLIATRIARSHLDTMARIGVRYDLLPWEGDILRLRFWEHAFELLKQERAVRLAASGKNRGCWVMDLPEESGGEGEDRAEKVIVRSNGTVTYVGKDIAYQLWKLGLLPRNFHFQRFYTYPDGAVVWSTSSEPGESDAPAFGGGTVVYNVIDSRQAYLQQIVQLGVSRIGTEQARERSHHFSYEMVALTPATCRELGFPVSEEEAKKPYLEVSGRKGLGVKADDLIDALESRARGEVEKRNPDFPEEERRRMAQAIAQGALRYFMIKFTRNKVIAFDFGEALNFEGDSGPYLQYAVVRARNIFRKMGLVEPADYGLPGADQELPDWKGLESQEANELWDLAFAASRLAAATSEARRAEEPAVLARFARELAQKFNAFYHRYPIMNEPDPTRKALRLLVTRIFHRQAKAALELMGIPVPERM
jgi:arginyl-tRNA synthetase